MLHADDKYFNMESDEINTIGEDYRIVIRDDSRLFPLSDNTIKNDMVMNTNLGFEPETFNKELFNKKSFDDKKSDTINNDEQILGIESLKNSESNVISGTTNAESKWMLSSEEYLEEKNKNNIVKDVRKVKNNDSRSDSSDNDSDSDSSNTNTENLDEDNDDSDSESENKEEQIIGLMNDLSVEEYGDETKTDSQILDSIEKELRSAIED